VSDQDARDLEAFLYELRDMVENARTMPMSASVLVNRDDAVALVEDILRSFPEELRHARWLLKEKEQFLGQARREADDIIELARVQAERMVERTEIAREARRTAQRIVDDAQMQARQLVHEAEDYIDQKLAAFETVLERTLQTVQKGRNRLQVAVESTMQTGDVADAEGLGGEFFDQDGG
jgi:F0F1-type ATP synthase membrane subunit b/b'